MPNPLQRHKPTKLAAHSGTQPRTLKVKQRANGRTLALNGATWAKLRRLVMGEQPLCSHCLQRGLIVTGNEVDHIDNDAGNNLRSNLVNLCRACHSSKTQRYEHYKRTGQWLPVKGCDVNGMPLDPNHHWNKKSPEPAGCEPRPQAHARDRTSIFHRVK